MSDASNTVPAGPSALDLESAACDVAGLVALAQWIEGARATIDSLRLKAIVYPGLRDALKESDVRFGVDWQEEESTGLHLLLRGIGESVAALDVKREVAGSPTQP